MSGVFTISRQFTFCYGHRLLRHTGKCAHPHGHNGTAEVMLRTEQLNSQGMVTDFTEMKGSIGEWIETHLDHRMILEQGDPLVRLLQEMGETVFVLPAEPTAEHLAELIFDAAEKSGLPVVSVTFWETPQCAATFSRTG